MDVSKTEEQLKKISEQIKIENYDALKEHMDDIKKLSVLSTVEVKEKDFIKYFLPMFNNDVKVNEQNISIFINNIYMLTNSYNRPIQIITDDGDQKLFKLPPIALDIKDEELIKNINFINLINMYTTMSDSGNTQLADNTLSGLTNALGNVLEPDEQIVSSYNKDILFMYDRYNIKYSEDENSVGTIVKKDLVDDIEFDYDG